MSEDQNELSVYELKRFEQTLSKLSGVERQIVENEIDKIIANSEIGGTKKDDLTFLRVHKFRLEKQQVCSVILG